jgi:conjugal transfer pilus assembly protein TraL
MRDIPNYLDDPQQILFWEFDEVILLSIMFSIGIIVNQLSVLIIIGLIGIKFFRKVKDRQANGFLQHAVYWYTGIGSTDKGITSKPLPFIRRYF